MFNTLLLSSFATMAFAAPLAQSGVLPSLDSSTWTPAPGFETTCEADAQELISLDLEPQLEKVLNEACAAMMPPCAYPELLREDTVCIKTVVWPLEEAVESTQTFEGETSAGGQVRFSVTPNAQPEDAPPVQWTKQECYGYFSQMLQKSQPEGCRREQGFGTGKLVAGGDSPFKGMIFEVAIVSEE
ncbi:hypothetical protein DE146DRAFT_275767 [Phaeosphaeria sp. MPI-PUGE-AT-0046c]|nr:hypothetical protein DE146DRAFT_275767 [Phaeosphaeria sp. MPI-PUGE-AT-0046c]